MIDKKMYYKKNKSESSEQIAETEKPKTVLLKPKNDPKQKMNKSNAPMKNKVDHKSKRKP